MQQIAEQEKAKDFKQFNACMTCVRTGGDKIWAALGHDEIVTVAPIKTVFIIDAELILSISDAEMLGNNLLANVKAVKEQMAQSAHLTEGGKN